MAGARALQARLPHARDLEPGHRQVRGTRADLWHARHLVPRAAARRSRSASASPSSSPSWRLPGSSGRSASPSSCWPRCRASSTASGACSCSRPSCSATCSRGSSSGIGPLPVVGKLFQGPPFGIGILTASFVLAIMVIPFISAVMRDVFETVPDVLKESGYGLGATTWEVIWQVVVPYARTGMIGGIMLGLGRALGETMAVTFVIGNAHRISTSLLAPGTTISASIANEFAEAVGDLYTSSLVALGRAAVPHHLRRHRRRAASCCCASSGARCPRYEAGARSARLINRAVALVLSGARDRDRAVLPRRDPVDADEERPRRHVGRSVHRDDPAAGQRRRAAERHLRQRRHDGHRHPDRRPDRHAGRHLPGRVRPHRAHLEP